MFPRLAPFLEVHPFTTNPYRVSPGDSCKVAEPSGARPRMLKCCLCHLTSYVTQKQLINLMPRFPHL